MCVNLSSRLQEYRLTSDNKTMLDGWLLPSEISVAFFCFKSFEFGPNRSLEKSLRIFAGIYVLAERPTTCCCSKHTIDTSLNFGRIQMLLYWDLPMCMIISLIAFNCICRRSRRWIRWIRHGGRIIVRGTTDNTLLLLLPLLSLSWILAEFARCSTGTPPHVYDY